MLLFFRSCKPYANVNVVYKKSVLNIMSPQLSSLSFVGLLPGNEIIIIVSGLDLNFAPISIYHNLNFEFLQYRFQISHS